MPFVLIHGGGFAGSCWDQLRPLLHEASYAIDLPGRAGRPADLGSVTLADFASAVVDEITTHDLVDVVLVGHSLAGLTLPRVADRVPDRLRRLVFVSCTVPPDGVATADLLAELSPAVASVAARLGGAALDASGALNADLATVMFCNDMGPEQTASTLERMGPEALRVLSEPSDLSGLHHPIARTYVRLTRDAAITPAQQDVMIANLGGADTVDLDAAPMAMISRAAELAAVLNSL